MVGMAQQIVAVPHCVGCKHGAFYPISTYHDRGEEVVGRLFCIRESINVNGHSRRVDAYDACEFWGPAVTTLEEI